MNPPVHHAWFHAQELMCALHPANLYSCSVLVTNGKEGKKIPSALISTRNIVALLFLKARTTRAC